MLTYQEHQAVTVAGNLYTMLLDVVANGLTREQDLQELRGHIHAIQHAIMAQAAAREYPDMYRLLGKIITPVAERPVGAGWIHMEEPAPAATDAAPPA